MRKLFYCLDCKRVFENDKECTYCNSHEVKELVQNSPVNLLGSKLKGKVLKIEEDKVRVLFKDENNERFIKECDVDKLRKVL